MNKLIERTLEWNTSRGNTKETLNWGLEVAMLKEELSELDVSTNDVDRLDSLLDLVFVAYGSLGKMGLSTDTISKAYDIVVTANESKGSTKNSDGKIQKPEDFASPEEQLSLLLYPVD